MRKIFVIMWCMFLALGFHVKDSEAMILLPIVDGTIFDFNDDNVSDFVNGTESVQVLNMINFDSRGIMEFDFSSVSGPVSHALLRLYRNAALGPFPMTINVYGYPANGILSGTDYNAGSFLTSFNYNDEDVFDVDLTPHVQSAASSSYSYFGLNLRMNDQFSGTNAPPYASFTSLEIPPPGELHINGPINPAIPEPAAMFLFGGGMLGALAARRKRKHGL